MAATKIVIFEDEFLLATDLKRQLNQYGYEITAMFRKAEEGIRFLEESVDSNNFPDIVLLDISLAGKMTGIDAAEIITAKYPCAIVFLTGMSQLEVFEEAFKAKPFAFLIKPFEAHQAVVSIKLAAYQKNLENQLRRNSEELEIMVNERTKELKFAKDSAEAAIQLKNTVLSNMSIQIREPMYGILGLSAMLKDEMHDKPNLLRYAQYIEDNAKHLFTLLNNIMSLSDDPNPRSKSA